MTCLPESRLSLGDIGHWLYFHGNDQGWVPVQAQGLRGSLPQGAGLRPL